MAPTGRACSRCSLRGWSSLGVEGRGWPDCRKGGADGLRNTPVGHMVDVPNATYKNTIGDPLLTAYWKDTEFDAKQRAFYYVRVIQIPTPRWTAYDQKRFGIKMP